ncbi:hypothetical protein K7I13_06995 [Brucepastera parasyntrophica]|uniref:hypothetical protein n=1 Tax=Brucepastera parasyntrophica TaxID=2880008 RepID=UPI002109AACD|nr:hypothetical protein [Brucepastera parasyntrophica]ULQ60993.1 hypothetical protein K7I13_06995 [Brucepastera parasyntrophica]
MADIVIAHAVTLGASAGPVTFGAEKQGTGAAKQGNENAYKKKSKAVSGDHHNL